MERHPSRRARHPGLPAAAVVGGLASAALLAAWIGVSRLGGLDGPPESLLLDFCATFITIFGAMVVTVASVGWLPIRDRRGHRR